MRQVHLSDGASALCGGSWLDDAVEVPGPNHVAAARQRLEHHEGHAVVACRTQDDGRGVDRGNDVLDPSVVRDVVDTGGFPAAADDVEVDVGQKACGFEDEVDAVKP